MSGSDLDWYSNRERHWCYEAGRLPPGHERDVCFTVAAGYAQLAVKTKDAEARRRATVVLAGGTEMEHAATMEPDYKAMTTKELSDRLEALVGEAREGGLSDEEIIAQIENAIEALCEG